MHHVEEGRQSPPTLNFHVLLQNLDRGTVSCHIELVRADICVLMTKATSSQH